MKQYILPAMLAASVAAAAQAPLSPALRLQLDGSTNPARAAAMSAATATAAEVSMFVFFDNADVPARIEATGARVGTVASGIATVRADASLIADIADIDGVTYIDMAAPVATRLDAARTEAGIDRLHSGQELPSPFKGQGVIVGIVDRGFDYNHPNFLNADKTASRITRVWNQNSEGAAPDAFGYGTEYADADAISASVCDITTVTHGTHVAGIAAGSDDMAGYPGVAPEAELVLVSLNTDGMVYGDNTAVVDGIRYIFDYADAVGKPCVVNLSLGSHYGPHDGTSAFDRMTDELQGPGRIIVGAVGNEGDQFFHISHTFSGTPAERMGTVVDFYSPYTEYAQIEAWADEGMTIRVVPFLYGVADRSVVRECEPTVIGPDATGEGRYEFIYRNDGIGGTIKVNGEVNPSNGKTHAVAEFSFLHSDEYRVGFYVVSDDAGSVHLWTDSFYADFTDLGDKSLVKGDNNCTMGEVGGTGKRIVSVGPYVTRDHYTRFGIYYPSGEQEGYLMNSSSRGLTPDGRLKPEIAAPGSYIVSSISSAYTGDVAKATSVTWDGVKYSYGFDQGSSMSSPFVAGVLATWMQVCPDLTPEEAKEILAATARNDEFTGFLPLTGSNRWGYGKIDAHKGLVECIGRAGVRGIEADADGAVSATLSNRNLHIVLSSGSSADVHLFNTSGTEVFSRTIDGLTPGETATINLDGLAEGIYVARIGTSASTTSLKLSIQ